MAIEVFPPALLAKDKEDEVVVLLQQLPITARRKKEVLIEWTKYVGAVITKELVDKVLGERAREI